MRVELSHQDLALVFLLLAVTVPRTLSLVISKRLSFALKWFSRLSTCAFTAFTASAITRQSRPLPILFLISFLCYFLLESMYVWFIIAKYTKLDLSLFIRYEPRDDTLTWPAGKVFEKIRQTLARYEFKFAETLAVTIGSAPVMISPIFYSSDGNVRLQLVFSCFDAKRIFTNCMLVSYARNGTILVTHDLQSPIAFFYVPPFEAHQRQFATVEGLLISHSKRLKEQKNLVCLAGENCLEAINGEQSKLEEANVARGYCEYLGGKINATISLLGRYGLWISSLRLSYLGL
jgi:hypothetical protein